MVGRGLSPGFVRFIGDYSCTLKGHSQDSRKNTRATIERFAVWLSQHITSFLSITPELCLKWFEFIRSRPDLNVDAVYDNISKVSNFLDHFLSTARPVGLVINPLLEIKGEYRPTRLHYGRAHIRPQSSIDALTRLLRMNSGNESGLRELVLFELLIGTPLRIQEIINLKLDSFDMNRGIIKTKQNDIILSEHLRCALLSYVNLRSKRLQFPNPSPHLLTSENDGRLSYDWIKLKTYGAWSFCASCRINAKVLKLHWKNSISKDNHSL